MVSFFCSFALFPFPLRLAPGSDPGASRSAPAAAWMGRRSDLRGVVLSSARKPSPRTGLGGPVGVCRVFRFRFHSTRFDGDRIERETLAFFFALTRVWPGTTFPGVASRDAGGGVATAEDDTIIRWWGGWPKGKIWNTRELRKLERGVRIGGAVVG